MPYFWGAKIVAIIFFSPGKSVIMSAQFLELDWFLLCLRGLHLGGMNMPSCPQSSGSSQKYLKRTCVKTLSFLHTFDLSISFGNS